jgi:3'5'-cyclic nucleotide phosphodiesterase
MKLTAIASFLAQSHVTMSVVKLLSRIVAPSSNDMEGNESAEASTLHDFTFGITSDPLTRFSCVLSALIHDLDHRGVPNAQLVKEGDKLAIAYKNQSPAEQNSIDIAWNLLMEERFEDFRATIYTSESEMKRFRALVVNSVMATDICDKELKVLRNSRWDRAFSASEAADTEDEQTAINRKATIVIEHLIQASDVSHTMQHVSLALISASDCPVHLFSRSLGFAPPFLSGKSTVNGTRGFSWNVTKPIVRVARIPTLLKGGTREKLDSSTFT